MKRRAARNSAGVESWGLCKLPRCFASLLARDQRCCTKPHRTARGGDGLPAHCSALRLHRSPGPGRAELHVRPTVWGARSSSKLFGCLGPSSASWDTQHTRCCARCTLPPDGARRSTGCPSTAPPVPRFHPPEAFCPPKRSVHFANEPFCCSADALAPAEPRAPPAPSVRCR